MVSFDGRQSRQFPLEGLAKVVGGRERTRRLNRRERRHLASESSLWVRSYCREEEPKGGCLAPQHQYWRGRTNRSAPTIVETLSGKEDVPSMMVAMLRSGGARHYREGWIARKTAD